MAVVKEKKVYLTEDQKMEIIKAYDESGNAKQVCKKYKIGLRTLYHYKTQLWDIYQSTKETVSNKAKIATINNVKVDNSRRIALIERKSGDVLEKVLNIMEHKLDIEELRLKGEHDTEDKISVMELTNFFRVAAPFFFQPLVPDEAKGKTLMNTHKYITNILNQQVNVNKQNQD